jgi:hypothetical protein
LLGSIMPGMVAEGAGATERISPMHPSEEFLKHAAECKRMARFAREPQDKVTWRKMSERWLRCAEWSEKETRTARSKPTKQAYGSITVAFARN